MGEPVCLIPAQESTVDIDSSPTFRHCTCSFHHAIDKTHGARHTISGLSTGLKQPASTVPDSPLPYTCAGTHNLPPRCGSRNSYAEQLFQSGSTVRRIVVTGVLGGIIILQSLVQILGYPPIPIPPGNATTIQITVVIGAILRRPHRRPDPRLHLRRLQFSAGYIRSVQEPICRHSAAPPNRPSRLLCLHPPPSLERTAWAGGRWRSGRTDEQHPGHRRADTLWTVDNRRHSATDAGYRHRSGAIRCTHRCCRLCRAATRRNRRRRIVSLMAIRRFSRQIDTLTKIISRSGLRA